MRYADVKQFIVDGLAETPWRDVEIVPGPNDAEHADQVIVLTPEGGLGEDTEGATDRVGYQVRAIGGQNDFEDAEGLALEIDRVVRSGAYTRTLSTGVRLVTAWRVGGAPSPLFVDDADRWNFTCSYMFESPTE